ncbi:MAG: hypothetical protein NC324_02670 [Bacteroides sp.]|nr:hypothetical protein [Bacteroides sp.]
MEKQNIQVNFAAGQSVAELIIREGAAPNQLEPKPPVAIALHGVIGAPFEFLRKRLGTGQFAQGQSYILVNREEVKISLVFNESDYYNRGMVTGQLAYNQKFIDFGINCGKAWTPAELGMFLKMNRAFFPDRNENMRLVTELMNFTAEVNNRIERAVKESGDRTDNFAQAVNSNLPASFVIQMPIFKGLPAERIEVETFANVNGREVTFVLLSPGAQSSLEDLRDKVIDEQLEQIREIAPDIAIIEV